MVALERTSTRQEELSKFIVVLEDDDETRRGIERLLLTSGYRVQAERNADAALARIRLSLPDLLLISTGASRENRLRIARQICTESRLRKHHLPVVIFCDADLEEGEERHVGNNFYLARPNNFDQLRALIKRLLAEPGRHCPAVFF